MKSPVIVVIVSLILCSFAREAWSDTIPFTNFANYRRISADGIIYGGNPLEAKNPLDETSAPWTWYTETMHEPAPFWPVFDGTVTYFDQAIPGGPPTFLPDGRVLFAMETITTIEARDEPGGEVVGTMTLRSTEPHPGIIDINPDRLIVDEMSGMVLSRGWTGDNSEPVPEPWAYVVESETGIFADDPYEFLGEQSISYNALFAYPLVEGLTPAESVMSTVADGPRRLLGVVGELVWSGQYETVPEPSTLWLGASALLGALVFVRSLAHRRSP